LFVGKPGGAGAVDGGYPDNRIAWPKVGPDVEQWTIAAG